MGQHSPIHREIGAISEYMERLPYQARLDYYQLSHAERALIRAMCSCSPPAGFTVWLDIEDLGRRANLSRKQVQRLIHGYKDKRNGKNHTGLKARGILTEVAKAHRGRRRPATYRVNWDAFEIDPALVGVLERRMQMTLPGIKRPAVPGEEINTSPLSATATGDMRHRDACPAETPLTPKAQQKLPLLRPVMHSHSGSRQLPVGETASGARVAVTQQIGHGDAVDASPRRSTCVTVTPIVLDSSIRFSNESKNRSSSLQPRQHLEPSGPQQNAPVKSWWEKLPEGLLQRLIKQLKNISEANVGAGSYLDERTPEEIAGEQKHLVLVAAERAGIWPQVAKHLADETFASCLAEERIKQKRGFDA